MTNKKNSYIVLLFIYSLCYAQISLQASSCSATHQVGQAKKIIVESAKKEIKQVVVDDPSVFTMSCTYKVFNGKPFLAQKKLYYTEYRRKSDHTEIPLPKKFAQKMPDSIFEVTFKRPHRGKFLSLVHRDPLRKNCRLGSELIELPVGFFA